MLDVELFGMRAGAHLMVNAALHALSSILLYEILRRATGRRVPSAFAAALFALHPLRVESVAWVSERKDVLSAALGLGAVTAYIWYARRRTSARFALVVALFALGLLAKPMLVTLPFALLLLDYWPLARIAGVSDRAGSRGFPVRSPAALALEKLPLVLLAAAASAVTFAVQRRAGAVVSTADVPIPLRVENAIVAYASYLWSTLWPTHLAVFYPLHAPIPAWQIAAAAAALVAISAAVLAGFARRPYLLTGWLWYLGMLVPVIGLVRVGDQALADRYTYLPSIGLYVMIAWGTADLLPRHRSVLAAAAAAVLATCAALSWAQVRHWRDTESLFQHAIAVTGGNYVAHTNLGALLLERGHAEDALRHFEEAVRLRPDHRRAQINIGIARGIVLADRGDYAAAAARYAEVLAADPSNAMAHFNWGALLARQGDLDGAVQHYSEAIRLSPGYAKAENNLGLVLARKGQWTEAAVHYRRAIDAAPQLAEAYGNLGVALETSGDKSGALAAYRELVRLKPREPKGRYNLAGLLVDLGQKDEAVVEYREALRLQPGWEPAEQALRSLGVSGS
jgi:tetratricopeptide (TPR) repeat protein